MIARRISIALLALLSAPLLHAASPASVETRKSLADGVLLPAGSLTAPARQTTAEDPELRILVLPGLPASQVKAATAPTPPVAAPVAPQTAPPAMLATSRPAAPPAPVREETRPPLRSTAPPVPEGLLEDGVQYLQRQIGRWTAGEARRLLGTQQRHRQAYDEDKKADGDIYAFADPTKRYREFELDFDKQSGLLRTIFIYPWNLTWDEARRRWTGAVSATAASNGRKFYSYANRRLDVLVDGKGTVVSLGLY
jgi:hypothetical protein